MNLIKKIRKRFGWYNLQKETTEYIRKTYGNETAEKFAKDYISLNRGIAIGDMVETSKFLQLLKEAKENFWEE